MSNVALPPPLPGSLDRALGAPIQRLRNYLAIKLQPAECRFIWQYALKSSAVLPGRWFQDNGSGFFRFFV
jgi:hypothetical protein